MGVHKWAVEDRETASSTSAASKGSFLSYHEGRLPDEETVLLLLDNFHDTMYKE